MEVREYAACDATELARLIREREVSTDEVLDAARRAIDEVDPKINAIVHGPFDDVAPPSDGPFSGVPFATKDTLFEAGRPVELGSRLLSGFLAPIDTILMQRFRDVGLVNLAHTATPELAFNIDTAPVTNGPTRNPWDPARGPGGSSGGAAALVAARAVPFAHGNDGGGSIRIPAGWCGLVGLKPTRARVPVGPLNGEMVFGSAHEFALTRSVRDAAGLLDAVDGPAPGDRYYIADPDEPFASCVGRDPGRLRIAVHTESYWGRPTEPDVREAVESVARQLEALGHSVEPACPHVFAEPLHEMHLVLWSVALASIAGGLAAVARRDIDGSTLEAATLAVVRHGQGLSALDVAHALGTQNNVSRAWGPFLDDYDLFICPTTPTLAPLSGTPDMNAAEYENVHAWMDELFSWIPFTPIANATGQPSVSLPLGTSSDGLPIGVMFTAQTLREDLLLSVAAQLEEAMPWSARTPAVCAGS